MVELSTELTEKLKNFLIARIRVISDAEPNTMADYVLALLKHDKSVTDLRDTCKNQLKDFLGPHTDEFVDGLFGLLMDIDELGPVQAFERHMYSEINVEDRGRSLHSEDVPMDRDRSASPRPHERYRDRLDRRRRAYDDDDEYDRADRYREHNDVDMDDHDDNDDRRSYQRGHDSRYTSRIRQDSSFDRGSRRGRRGGRGRFGQSRYHASSHQQYKSFEPIEPKIEISKIPHEYLNEQQILEYFSQFGQIQKVYVYPRKSSAMVEYENMDQAKAAISSLEAPFGNRFIMIKWYKDLRAAIRNRRPYQRGGHYPNTRSFPPSANTKQIAPRAELSEQEMAEQKQELEKVRQQMEELKRKQDQERRLLIEKLGEVSEQDKKEILSSLSQVSHKLAGPESSSKRASASSLNGNTTLFKSNTEVTTTSVDAQNQHDQSFSMETGGSTFSREGQGSFSRGAGRFQRGRGRATKVNRSLDLRTRCLRIAVPGTLTEYAQNPNALREKFEQFGKLEVFQPVEISGQPQQLLVQFSARWQAEKAMAKAGMLLSNSNATMDAGELHVDWNPQGNIQDVSPETSSF